jgi:hypothetical protein
MLGQAAVAIWCDVAPAARDEFDDWHAHEHMPERLSIPGFLRGSRWVTADGAYFMLYEAQTADTVTTGPYLERLNDPTPWSRKMMPQHRNMVRSVCRVHCAFGAGLGRALLTVRFSPQPGGEERLEAWLAAELLPALPSRKGLLAAALLRNIASPARAETTEEKIRGGDAAADWIVLVTGHDADAVAAVQINEAPVAACVYSLACVMNAGDVRPTR